MMLSRYIGGILFMLCCSTTGTIIGRAEAQLSSVGMYERSVVTDKMAYIAYPPELVAEPVVTNLSVSMSGRYALAQRMKETVTPEMLKFPATPVNKSKQDQSQGVQLPVVQDTAPVEVSLVLWDSRTKLRQTLWKADASEAQILQMTWLPKADVAFAQIFENERQKPKAPENAQQNTHPQITQRVKLLRISAIAGRASEVNLGDFADSDMLQLTPSPKLPVSLLQCIRYPHAAQGYTVTLALLEESGNILAHLSLPKDAHIEEIRWGDNGQPLLKILQPTRDPKGNVPAWWSMNMRTAELTRLPVDPKSPEPSVKDRAQVIVMPTKASNTSALRLTHLLSSIPNASTRGKIGLLWLESNVKSDDKAEVKSTNKTDANVAVSKTYRKKDKSRLLLSSDSTGGQLVASGERVFFHSQGAVWAVSLLAMDLDSYQFLRRQADRMQTMSRAKQAGLALMMYAQDFDETFPGGGDIATLLAPYVQDGSILDGFNYTYAGGKLADIASPATTIIGTMDGEEGRANVYADGHVKWE